VKRILLEAAVTTCDEARSAAAAGADRLELCTALELGGLTPSPGTFLAARDVVALPIYPLIRPRPGGFHYSASALETMLRDAEWFLRNGAEGIVFGILGAEGCIDRTGCAKLVAAAAGRAVFHRAFEFVADQPSALEELIGLGFQRVLTSGGAATAAEGSAAIAKLVRAAAGRIEILPGGGIRPDNAMQLLNETGCRQVHGSFRTPLVNDGQASPRLAEQMGGQWALDANAVCTMRAALDRFAASPRAAPD
jgi:copper homeostasis protein CutC